MPPPEPQGWPWPAHAPLNGGPLNDGPLNDDGRSAETATAFARCFSTPDGARALTALTAMTLGRALGPEASDAALRQLEGQRRLVLTIRALIERGRRERD